MHNYNFFPFKKIITILIYYTMQNNNTANNTRTIYQLMNEYQLSLRKLAALSGVSPSMLSRLLHGKRTFLTRHKNNIAKVFQLDKENIKWPPK